jgi:hypothetical protein
VLCQALVLSPLGIAQARRQQMGPTGALDPDLLWPIQRSPIQCVWPSTVELGQLWGAFMVLSTTLGMCRFCLSEGLESAPPTKGQGVSIQRLSSNLFNMSEWSKVQ